MSRWFGVTVLVATFAFCGYILWRLAPKPGLNEAIKVHRSPAEVEVVQRDLCAFALAESKYWYERGHYASFDELRSHEKLNLPPDGRWPYIYVLHNSTPEGFVIAAVSGEMSVEPRILTVDEQLQVQTQGKPRRVWPCGTE
jgi:hypothetical protein